MTAIPSAADPVSSAREPTKASGPQVTLPASAAPGHTWTPSAMHPSWSTLEFECRITQRPISAPTLTTAPASTTLPAPIGVPAAIEENGCTTVASVPPRASMPRARRVRVAWSPIPTTMA